MTDVSGSPPKYIALLQKIYILGRFLSFIKRNFLLDGG